MKTINVWLCALAMLGVTAGCSEEVFPEEEVEVTDEAPFVLYATCGSDADTRLAFGEDGIDLKWEDGDQLVLIDVSNMEQVVDPIYLTTHLDEPSATAEFRSEYAVPAGRYFVRNMGSVIYRTPKDWMSFGRREDDWSDHRSGYELKSFSEGETWYDKDILYAPVIEIKEGQVSATIELKHAFCMLKFNITGAELLTKQGGISVGMLCPTKAFPVYARLDEKGENFNQVLTGTSRIECGSEIGGNKEQLIEKVNGMCALVLPVDMTGQKVYFYVGEHLDVSFIDYIRQEHIYEFVKDGKDLKPGVAYTVNLNLAEAKKIVIEDGELSTPDHFRALAYHPLYNDYTVTQDIDFSGQPFFPMRSSLENFDGQGHTLSNLTIDWPFDGAGLFEKIANGNNLSNLNLENVTIKGVNQVGAFCGILGSRSILSNCHLLGTNNISGTGNYIGGITGGNSNSQTLSGCSVSNATTVSGVDFVGGLIGEGYTIANSSSAAIVKGENNVGGIAGHCYGMVSDCTSSAQITATGNLAGGIIGGTTTKDVVGYSAGKVAQSSFTGSVSGNDYVGGIIGTGGRDNSITTSFSTGTISGASNVGGISGAGCVVTNCYSLSEITGTDAATTAGIIGGEISTSIEKCYFAGTLKGSGQYGISGGGKLYQGAYSNIKNCLTTAAKLSGSDQEADAQYVNLTSIKNQVNYINADKVYSEQTVWEDYANECPKFLWQIPSTKTEGVTAPSFETDEW